MVTTYFNMICMCLMTLNCTGPGMYPPCFLLKLNMLKQCALLKCSRLWLCSPQVILYVSICRLPLSERHLASGTTPVLSWPAAGDKPPSILWPSSCAYWLCSLQGKNPQFGDNCNTYHVSKIQPASKWTGLTSQCFRKITRYWWSDVLTNTPLLSRNWEFSMGLLLGPIGTKFFLSCSCHLKAPTASATVCSIIINQNVTKFRRWSRAKCWMQWRPSNWKSWFNCSHNSRNINFCDF